MYCNLPEKLHTCYDMIVRQLQVDQGVLHICAENNSYLPLGDRFVSVYCVKKEFFSDLCNWEAIPTNDGVFESELEFAFPMQMVRTKIPFKWKQLGRSEYYIIIRINDSSNTLSRFPDTGIPIRAADFDGEDFWSVLDINDYYFPMAEVPLEKEHVLI